MEVRMTQFAFDCSRIGGLRLVEAIQSGVVNHEDRVGDGEVRAHSDCICTFFNPFLILPQDRQNYPRQ